MDILLGDLESDDTTVIWQFRVYIAGRATKSLDAISNLKKLCEEYLPERYDIQIVDLLEQPELAEEAQIIAIPTTVKYLPEPIRKVIGDLSDKEKTRIGFQIKPLVS